MLSGKALDRLMDDIKNHNHAVGEKLLLDILIAVRAVGTKACVSGPTIDYLSRLTMCTVITEVCEILGNDTDIIDTMLAERIEQLLAGKHGGY